VDNIASVFLTRILFLITAKRREKAVINLDVVTRHYRVITCHYNEIRILMMPCITQHFTIQVGTMSTGNHSDAH